MSKYNTILYSSRKGGFVDEQNELKYPLMAGYEVPLLMYYIVRAMDNPEEEGVLQRIYSELLENYIEKDLLK